MNKKNWVDIIIPAYNSEKYIYKTIKSVLYQTYKNWRLIIIDDASTDGTKKKIFKIVKKIKNNKKIIIFKNKFNKGQAFCRNKGLKYSKSKFIAFLDSDDYWDKNKLKNQIKFMLSNNYNFTYTDYKTIKNNIVKTIKTPNFFNYKNFVKNTSIATSTMLIKKKILDKATFPKLKFCEDYYFKCKILKFNDAYRCSGSYAFYRLRKDSLQSNRLKILFALWNINKFLNKMNYIDNLISIFFITYNSLKKYAFR
jgi:teichuronic acid biosynthesis glycosyltransferase TuaG